jgi:hypothetical protein
MNEQIEKLNQQLKPAILFIKKNMVFIAIVIFLIVYSVIVIRINNLASATPSEAEVQSKLQTISQPSIDKTLLAKVKQLQDQNIQVQALFNQARNNPFSE